jgi:hypothetical protein
MSAEPVVALDLGSTLTRSREVLYEPIDAKDGVMMSIADGKFYDANSVAGRIWQLLETPRTVADLCAALQAEFKVDASVCETEVLTFASDLVRRGLLAAS